MCLKWIVILIAVKQGVPAIQTESCDEAINRLTNRDPTLPQGSVVLRRGHGQVDSACAEHLESQEIVLHLREHCVVPNSLHYFPKDQAGTPHPLTHSSPIHQ